MKFLKFLIIFTFLITNIFAACGYLEPWGEDASLSITYKKEEKKKEKKGHLLTKIADNIINFHQKVLSPIDGPRSNFRPTSSRYMQLAIKRYGFLKGAIMGFDRLLRENNEKWVYQKIIIDNIEYKFDPAFNKKYIR